MPIIEYRDAVRDAMSEEMRRDPDVFLMGEEVGYYHGAYKASRGMIDEFGPKRVIDTPITELGFAALGVGAAMAGLKPIIEFMTYNFAILALDQVINTAAKVRYMSNGQFGCPIVFRGPTGAGGELAAQHSQALEAQYTHIPGLIVIAAATPYDLKGLLKSAIRDPNPVCFFEAETLYNFKGEVPEGEYTIPIGKADIKRPGKDVTLVTWLRPVHTCLAVAETLAKEHNIDAEVIDLRTLRPLDMETVLASVRKTNRVVVVQEGWPHSSVSSEIVTQIQEQAFDDLDAPVLRVTNLDVPMPYAKALEAEIVPNPARIIEAVKRVCYTK
jgi:pyruvate dehydrogenase E1 component beta subunit